KFFLPPSPMKVALRSSLNFDIDKPFDTELAFKIYQQTFGIFVDKVQGKTRLSVVANGALTLRRLSAFPPTPRTTYAQSVTKRECECRCLPIRQRLDLDVDSKKKGRADLRP